MSGSDVPQTRVGGRWRIDTGGREVGFVTDMPLQPPLRGYSARHRLTNSAEHPDRQTRQAGTPANYFAGQALFLQGKLVRYKRQVDVAADTVGAAVVDGHRFRPLGLADGHDAGPDGQSPVDGSRGETLADGLHDRGRSISDRSPRTPRNTPGCRCRRADRPGRLRRANNLPYRCRSGAGSACRSSGTPRRDGPFVLFSDSHERKGHGSDR